jgi:hypothetical protein
MSEPKGLEPLDAEIASLLKGASLRDHAPDGAEARILARLAANAPALAAFVPAAALGTAATANAGATAKAGTAVATAKAGTAVTAAKAGAVSMLAGKGLVPLAVAFLVGGATGGAAVHFGTAPRERVVVNERSAPPSVPAAVAPSAPPEAPTPSVAPTQARHLVPAASAPPTTSAGPSAAQFAAERKVLDAARLAFARGEPEAALRELDAHARDFPRGSLSEEREALGVRALAEAGRRDEASARSARFKARFPGSLLLPVVEAVTREAPRP